MRKGEQPAAMLFRQLAEAKREEDAKERADQDARLAALDKLWKEKRAEFGPLVLAPAKGEILRKAQRAAERGELEITMDLGVNEDRLRLTSSVKEFAFAEAALAEKALLSPQWEYLDRLGWLLQTRDGKQLSEHGQALTDELRSMGFRTRFSPHYIKDHPANPYFNALLDLDWRTPDQPPRHK